MTRLRLTRHDKHQGTVALDAARMRAGARDRTRARPTRPHFPQSATGIPRASGLVVSNGVNPPFTRNAFEFVLSMVIELDAGACHEVFYGSRYENFSGLGEGRDPGAEVNRDPARFPPSRSHSPVCRPARTWMPSSAAEATIARAQAIPLAGPSKLAKKPSPAVSSSRPPNRASSRRTCARCEALMALGVPGEGVEPSRPLGGHPILSRARMTSFATPAE